MRLDILKIAFWLWSVNETRFELQKQGYSRKGSENVVGPMPPFGQIVKSDDDMWKIIAFIRSVNPSSAEGSSASAE